MRLALVSTLALGVCLWLTLDESRDRWPHEIVSMSAMTAADGCPLTTDATRRETVATTLPGAASPCAAEKGEQGRLLLLDLASRRPPAGTSGSARSLASAARQEFVVSADGYVSLAAGRWQLSSSADWSPVGTAEFDVTPRDTQVVWVSRPVTFRIQVASVGGAPVAGAQVAWVAHARSAAAALLATTDERGLAALSAPSSAPGTCTVSAAGYRTEQRLLQPDGEGVLDVLLRPAVERVTQCRAVEARLGTPLEGIAMSFERGLLGVSGPGGALSVPADVQWVRLAGPGLIPTGFEREALQEGASLGVPLRSRVRVSVDGASQGDRAGKLLAHVLEAPEGCNGSLEDYTEAALVDGQASLDLPCFATVRVFAFADDGRTGQLEFTPVCGEEARVIALGSGPELRLELASEGLDLASERPSLREATVRVEYHGKHRAAARLDANGHFAVPMPELVRSIEVAAPGYVPTRLVPIATESSRDGLVLLTLTRALDVGIRLVDPRDLPVSGAKLTLSSMDTGARIRPDLFGAWPTGHPAWAEKRCMNRVATTDVDGAASLALAAGRYLVYVGVPDALHITPGNASGYLQSFQLEVARAEEYRWTVQDMRRLCLSVFYADTRAPVERFELSVPGVMAGAGDSVEGNYWEGWIGSETARVTIRAGLAGATVELPVGEERTLRREVLLAPEKASRICVSGDAQALAGRKVEVLAERDVDGTWLVVWQCDAALDAEGCLELGIPVEDAWITVRDAAGGDESRGNSALAFQPARVRVSAGAELRYSASLLSAAR